MSEYIVAIAGEPPSWGEPIVRCRDCKKCNIGWCLHFHNIVKPDGYCAWGERKVVSE